MTATAQAPTETVQDRIERSVLIQAPRSRVWHALADAEQFGRWFGVDLKGQRFAAGQRTQAPFTIPGHEHMAFEILMEQVEPEHTLTWRWYPHLVNTAADATPEERTRVTFTLQDAPGNATLVTVVETGFAKVAPARRLESFRGNTNGWEFQAARLKQYAEQQA